MTALTPAQQAKLRDVLGDYYGKADWFIDDVIERMGGSVPDPADESGVRPPEDDPEMPDDPTGASGCADSFQPLKSPVTDTRSAFGAHTAKLVAGAPPTLRGCAPSFR
jgi:hypothetical protein